MILVFVEISVHLDNLYFLVNSLVETHEYKRHWNELINKEAAISNIKLAEEFSEITSSMFEEIEIIQATDEDVERFSNTHYCSVAECSMCPGEYRGIEKTAVNVLKKHVNE